MENKKKYFIIGIIVIIMLVVAMFTFRFSINSHEETDDNDLNNINPEQSDEALEEIKVTGYHLVTYAQASNTNSFVKSITVNASNNGNIRFVIGSIDSDSIVQERTEFEIECKKGENTIDLLEERYLVKQGEYLFMDIAGQDILYTQEGTSAESLVQVESNKVSGKMIMNKSDFILPFKYTLEKAQEYNALVIGNDITTKNGGTGLSATDDAHDYYNLTKKRLEDTFDTVNINRINAKEWEENTSIGTRMDWIDTNLKESTITDLDLLIFQLGDNYTNLEGFEESVTEMVERIRKYSPNAEMIWIGLWDGNEKILNALPGICERLEIEFINIRDLSVPEYQSLEQNVSENVNENYTTFENLNQVFYPNNEAMQIISNRIIEILKFDF